MTGVRVLVLSTYESGHRPLVAIDVADRLPAAGHDVRLVDLAVDSLPDDAVDWADHVVLSVPMHTALRLAQRVVGRLGDLPRSYVGLYAAAAEAADPAAVPVPVTATARTTTRVTTIALPGLDRYARMERDGTRVLAAAVETTAGCSHRCTHCPVPVVFDGRIVRHDEDRVLADIEAAVAEGARHVTFADPDFLNAPPHARRIVAAAHAAFPDLTWDATVKVEHVLRHRDVWPEMAAAGCVFVVSAFESVDDATLVRLDKGHTAADAAEAVHVLRRAGIEVRPTWLPFTPWTSAQHLVDLVDFVAGHDLIPNVDPVQYTVRLLLPPGSLLLDHPDMRPHLGPYDAERLTFTWASPDPAIDDLQRDLAALVERATADGADVVSTFLDVNARIRAAAGTTSDLSPQLPTGSTEGRPRLTEPWFC